MNKIVAFISVTILFFSTLFAVVGICVEKELLPKWHAMVLCAVSGVFLFVAFEKKKTVHIDKLTIWVTVLDSNSLPSLCSTTINRAIGTGFILFQSLL